MARALQTLQARSPDWTNRILKLTQPTKKTKSHPVSLKTNSQLIQKHRLKKCIRKKKQAQQTGKNWCSASSHAGTMWLNALPARWTWNLLRMRTLTGTSTGATCLFSASASARFDPFNELTQLLISKCSLGKITSQRTSWEWWRSTRKSTRFSLRPGCYPRTQTTWRTSSIKKSARLLSWNLPTCARVAVFT